MNFDTTVNSADYRMKAGPGRCGFNMPAALKSSGSGESELSHGLPPYRPRKAFLVDRYPTCPANWMRSEGSTTSYFVPVKDGHGMWLDFNETLSSTANHVAIVISVQGVNAVTGQPCTDAHLEQYLERCPKHDVAFGPERLCKKCNYKWPKQNYVTSTATPSGQLWLDGFRAADGVVRQYILTAEKARGVANAIIGERRVFAIGVSFFLSKEPRPAPPKSVLRSWHGSGGGGQSVSSQSLDFYKAEPDEPGNISYGTSLKSSGGAASYSAACDTGEGRLLSAKPRATFEAGGRSRSAMAVSVQSMEVGAGAKIHQVVYDDPHDLNFWQPKPESILVINYVLEADVEKILAGGTVDVEGSSEGFLQKVPKGN